MKYFTPELIARGQSQDPSILNDVERMWDETCERYRAHLDKIRSKMPSGLRIIDECYYLHDSKIQGMGTGKLSFLIVLQLDTPPNFLLTLTYDLVREPDIKQIALPDEYRSDSGTVTWEYDELENDASDPSIWRQSILLSNGWEINLTFRNLSVQEAHTLPWVTQAQVLEPVPLGGRGNT